MKLDKLIKQYVEYRKNLGEKFTANEKRLKAFCKSVGESTTIESITESQINDFLYRGLTTVTPDWFNKHTALLGFYRYAFTRNYIAKIPLPNILPKRPPKFIPYIYSRGELKLIFDTALTYQKGHSCHSPYTIRTILVLTYSLGLRIHETLSICLTDIDMHNSSITIQKSKFYKSRLIPFNQEVKELINEYLQWRVKENYSQLPNSHFFSGKNNQSFSLSTIRNIFFRIRKKTGIERDKKESYQPRIHDLRHTFAVNMITSWYQDKKDVQQLLPILSVYLGHQGIAHTSVYLTMTNEVLKEANIRFEKYAIGE